MDNKIIKIWDATLYLRLSRDDGDKEESNSIQGQRQFLQDYVSRHADLHTYAIRIDDGFTGSNFDRPAFQAMLSDLKAGKTNCIIVKDLSRFGRNYLDAGEYIEKIFPFLNVRFIAVNDNYDSENGHAVTDGLVIPFKNLINEAYCRDISTKIRSQLEIKRKKGDFIGSFPVYGYLKDTDNKNVLVIDDYAADIVQRIFRMKLDGINPIDIANTLNTEGVLSPLMYKRSCGMKCYTPFQVNSKTVWAAAAITRILKNPVYVGTLVQGKITTPSFKVKKRVLRSKDEWAVVENNHEGIIGREDFESVQKILSRDTRKAPGKEGVYLFSGLVFCGECGDSMVRKTVPSGGKKYVYYVCSRNKAKKECGSHSMRDVALEELVFYAAREYISCVIEQQNMLELVDATALTTAKSQKIQRQINLKQEEAKHCQKLRMSLYENMVSGLLEQDEYLELKQSYMMQCNDAERQAACLHTQMESLLEHGGTELSWMEVFKKYKNITNLDRSFAVSIIEKILIYKDRRIEIIYRWQDEFALQKNFLNVSLKEGEVKSLTESAVI